jgi:HEAT repeat protein
MKNLVAIVIAGLCCLPAGAVDGPASIENARIELRTGVSPAVALEGVGRGKTAEWVGWSVRAVSEASDVCCFTRSFKRRGCSLSDRENSWGTSDNRERSGSTELYVLVETKAGRPSRVRLVSTGCPVDGADRRLVWLGPVDPEASLKALSRLLEPGAGDDDVEDTALAAIAYHADARADALLEKRAFDRSLSEDARKQAIFWAGNVRGEAGYHLVERVLTSDSSPDIREHAVFALTQSPVPGASERIKRVALEDRDNEVRAQALFWLAQTNVDGAGEWIVGRLDAEQDDHVREQAVFALSQLKDGTDWLLKVLRSKRDSETIRRALFWLGQSDDPRALQEIEKILEK